MAQTGQICRLLQSWARGKRQVHCSLCPLEHCLLLLVIDFIEWIRIFNFAITMPHNSAFVYLYFRLLCIP